MRNSQKTFVFQNKASDQLADKSAPTGGNIYKTLEQLAKKYPENDFLKLSLQLTPKNYAAGEGLNNKNLLNEAWSEKYGI